LNPQLSKVITSPFSLTSFSKAFCCHRSQQPRIASWPTKYLQVMIPTLPLLSRAGLLA